MPRPCVGRARPPTVLRGEMTANGTYSYELRWTGKASDLVEILYGMAEMGCINDGKITVGELAAFFYSLFNVEAKDCYRIYSDLKLRKNDSRTYFLDKTQEKLNRRMDMDEERERTRR